MKRLLAVAAVQEAATGVALMIAPVVASQLLLNADLSAAGAVVGRVAGLALLSFGLACWPSRDPASRSTAAPQAMLAYNVLITGYLIFLGIGGQFVGVLLWAAVAIHGLLSLCFIREWRRA